MAMTPQRARFVDEYLVDLNANRAAVRAGYAASMARQAAHRFLRDPEVAAAVAEAKSARAARTRTTCDRVIEELAAIAFSDIRRVAHWSEPDADGEQELRVRGAEALDADAARAIAEISRPARGALKVKMHDKLSALNSLARHLGLGPERAAAGAEEPLSMGGLTERVSALSPEQRAAMRAAIRTAVGE
jgi:phage terminase small subunit